MSKSFEEITQMLSLGTDSKEELKVMLDNKVEFRKKWGKLKSKSIQDAKGEKCFYCGKECSSFCNSHSIPSFVLKNIAVGGYVYNNFKLVNFPALDDSKGVNKTGTFQLICRECDSNIFQEYENPDNYENFPTAKMIAQIAMKNYMKSISKRRFEIALYKNMFTSIPEFSTDVYNNKQEINNLDLQEYIQEFNRAKRIANKGWENEYNLFYYQKLDYVVPVAFQSNVALLIDFEGNTINNIYNMSPDYHMKSIHICVFPLETTSVIMMFVDSRHKRYRTFCKQFRKLSHDDKLTAINYIIFSLSEDVYLNKDVDENILKDEGLVAISRQSSDIISTNPNVDTSPVVREHFDFAKMHEIPNLLSKEYKIK